MKMVAATGIALALLLAVLSARPAYASCVCDLPVEQLCREFHSPCPDDGGPGDPQCGERCCELCEGEGAAVCKNCSNPSPEPEDDGCSCRVGAGHAPQAPGLVTLLGVVAIGAGYARRRRR